MKKRKFIITGILFMMIIACFSVFVSAAERPQASTEQLIDSGWKTTDGKSYYIMTDSSKATGLCTLNGKKYYFGKSGVQLTGWRTIKGVTYYFAEHDGQKGYMVGYWKQGTKGGMYFNDPSGNNYKGIRTIGGKKYCFSENTGKQKTGWQTIDGKTYLFNEKDGRCGYMRGYWTICKSHYRFKNADGTYKTGFVTLSGRKYYFDSKGDQHTGWQKINGNYRYFRIANGKNGYMKTSCTVNAVRIDSEGKAVVSSAPDGKLNILIKANKLYEKLTLPTQSKVTRLHKCFDYIRDVPGYCTPRTFSASGHWEFRYALDVFNNNKGNCFSYGAALAFLASACGYDDVCAVSSGGHGWTEVNGRLYDADWARVSKADSYFDMPYSRSGKNGIPNYKACRGYVAKI